MADGTRLTSVETVREDGSWLFTVRDPYGELDEVLVVPCEDGSDVAGDEADPDRRSASADGGTGSVRAWVNRCTHEAQRLDRGFGAATRDGGIICPKHGSTFDACSGHCDNGDAAGTTLVDVDVTVADGDVLLTDDGYEFVHEGGVEDGDDGDGRDGPGDGGGTAIDGETPSWAGGDDDDDAPSSTSHIGL